MERVSTGKCYACLSTSIILTRESSIGGVLPSEEINADPIDLLRSHINDEESEINDKEELFEEEDDEQDEHRPDWMFLAEMGPKPNFDCSSDLGSRDMDQNHDWINNLRELLIYEPRGY
ncbi:hypothetical protein RhiirA5_441449 [Rhizophagus irregularis]|uniref:Uncharacterized protein n=1 Tax=Rhizophagus irregularis TaxID=588596 RepID=A0A2N0NFL4_9GLOM|nr:hypothetical protein RhiirA5_441449 [Rhizophagus irregularis]